MTLEAVSDRVRTFEDEERERLRRRAASAGEIVDDILRQHATWKAEKGFFAK